MIKLTKDDILTLYKIMVDNSREVRKQRCETRKNLFKFYYLEVNRFKYYFLIAFFLGLYIFVKMWLFCQNLMYL